MTKLEAFRALVTARAGGACEYCRLLQLGSGVTFHIEHIQPRSIGGQSILANLALNCPGCNYAKSQHTSGFDASGVEQRLFNPRDYEPSSLGWHLHFHIDRQSGQILPRTVVGEATIATLKINEPRQSFARKLQIDAGLIS